MRNQGLVSHSDHAGRLAGRDAAAGTTVAGGTTGSSSPGTTVGGVVSSVASAVHSALGGGINTLTQGGKSDGTETGTSSGNKARPILTNDFGIPLADCTHALQIAGHPVVSDTVLFEKQQRFNRAKIVERAVHACGSGAFGYFEVTHDLTHLCKASLFSAVGKKTPMFARFSTVTYGREFPDSARNPRGLAWKFYTEEGIYDILSVNFPSFFVRDPTMGPDVIRSQQRHPSSFKVDFDATFDFMR